GQAETTSVGASDGNLVVSSRSERKTAYKLTNRSKQERLVVVEHHASDWNLAGGEKPAESTRQTRRFERKIAPRKGRRKAVTETRAQTASTSLHKSLDLKQEWPAASVEQAAASVKASAELKAALVKLLANRKKLLVLRAEIKKADDELRPLLQDQE